MKKTDPNNNAEAEAPTLGRRIRGWFLFPIALFPLVALLTYDWKSIEALQTPAAPSTNWIGPLGDAFAYYGYQAFGLAVWVVPAFCVWGGCRLVSGTAHRPGVKSLWRLAFLVSAACLLQAMQGHAPGIDAATRRFNIMAAGGVSGYVLMTKCLAPLLSDIGAGVLALVLLAVTLIGSIGAGNIAAFFLAVGRWAAGRSAPFDPAGAEPGSPEYEKAKAAFDAAKKAREDAKRIREEEKQRAKAEKEAAKREKEERIAAAWKQREEEEERRRREAEGGEGAKKGDDAAAVVGRVAPNAPKDNENGGLRANRPTKQSSEAGAEATDAAPEDKGPYILPPIDLLNPLKKSDADHSDVGAMSQKLIDTLKLFNIDATMSYTVTGPVVTKYAILLAPGTRYSVVTSIADNLKGALHAKSLRIEAPIPGEECIGIEVPNRKPAGISFREIFESDAWTKSKAELPLLFGKDAAGRELVADLATMPHMLVAGATGQGKSVCLNSLINGLLMTRTPEQLKFIMVDPKSVEFTPYASIPHLLVPVITDNKKVVYSLRWAVAEMEKRLKMFARAKVKNIYDFNHRKTVTQPDMFGAESEVASDIPKTVPYIVIIIDELADLMASSAKEVTPDISRIAAKARAAGIHLILATQRPDARTVTGTIKANIPGRVAFKTASSVDSRTILDDTGAENLIGRGDMLYKGKDGALIRAQGSWIADEEIARITEFIEAHSTTQFDKTFATKLGRVKEASIEDPFKDNEDDPDNQPGGSAEEKAAQKMQVKAAADADDFKKAVECVINTRRASTSHFQRQLGWGYNHAAKILDMLTARGIVSEPQGMGPRQIVMEQEQLVAILNGDNAAVSEGGGGEAAGAAEAGLGDDASGLVAEEGADGAASEFDFDDSETEEQT